MFDIGDTESLKQNIKTSFDKVKDDFMRHNLKIAVLERENIFLRREMEKLQSKLKELSETMEANEAVEKEEQIILPDEISAPIQLAQSQQKYSASPSVSILSETDVLEQIFDKKIREVLSQVPQEMKGSQKYQIVRQERPVSNQFAETSLETEFLRKLRQNKRDIIKQRILEAIQTKKLSTLELKDYVVDKNNYCSKATFYRYLKELRKETPLGIVPDGEKSILVVIPQK